MLIERKYNVQFVTPGFVGGADQSGEWRSPPFKALLRQWWRVVWWHTVKDPTLQALRKAEGDLFGWAADTEKKAKKSQVLLRLESWKQGSQTDQDFNKIRFPKIEHPEVKDRQGKTRRIAASLYLGYGPVTFEKDSAALKRARAVAPGEKQTLTVRFPSAEEKCFQDVLKLIALFGTLGSRSRNGWGSLSLVPEEPARQEWPPATDFFNPETTQARDWIKRFSQDYRSALGEDWCHSIGKDEKGLLLWCTKAIEKWEDVLGELAKAKIAFRTQFPFEGGVRHQKRCDRQILAYPVTNHILDSWGQENRLANQILFKVLPDGKDRYRGLVVHMPHGLPKPLKDKLDSSTESTLKEREPKVWSKVHQTLDWHHGLIRLP